MRERRMEEQEEETVGKTTAKKMWLKYEFFPKASDPHPPSLLEFLRHFFQWVLLQVFNTENIIIL